MTDASLEAPSSSSRGVEISLANRSAAAREKGRIFAAATIAVVGAWLFAYAYRVAPLIPMEDAWTWILQAKAYAKGGITQLVEEGHPLVHGQHVYFIPALVALVLGPLVDYSMRPFAFLSVFFLLACGFVFYRFARKLGLGPIEALVVFLSVASLRHYENLAYGFQIGLPLSVALGSAAIMVADRRRDVRGLVIACCLATASVLSTSAGIFSVFAVLLVRWFDPWNIRDWIVTPLACAAVLFLVHIAILDANLMQESIVTYELARIGSSKWLGIFEDGVKLVGGGILGGSHATPVGLVLLAFACFVLVSQVRRERRIDAISGLILFALAATAAVAAARSPLVEPPSRHAIFTAPLVGACALRLVELMRSCRPDVRAGFAAAVTVGFAWLNAEAAWDSNTYQRTLSDAEVSTRTHLALVAGRQPLTHEDIAMVARGDAAYVRGLMEHLHEERLSIFDSAYRGIEIHDELPTRAVGATARSDRAGGEVVIAGAGRVSEQYTCAYESGCAARFCVDLAAKGEVRVGVIVRRADGSERDDQGSHVSDGEVVRHIVFVAAEAGETAEPYVRVCGDQGEARITSFSFVMADRSPIP